MKKYLLLSIILLLSGCYSFTGGNIPAHLKSIYIQPVLDQSGYGNPLFRDKLAQSLIDEFRSDNSFNINETAGGDAKLEVNIVNISDAPIAVSSGAIETERRVTVRCKAVYYDNVKRKEIWNKDFSAYQNYELNNALANRNEAIDVILEQIANDVLLAVVSGW
ncbi:MAG: LPS assembly lipoprotein LptE [Candidatus Kapaibacterium sp.]